MSAIAFPLLSRRHISQWRFTDTFLIYSSSSSCCDWGWPDGDHFPRWTPGNSRVLLTWHGWPARAGVGSPPGSESAPRAAGCSSWTRRPSEECPGSLWCSLLPPTGEGNDIQLTTFSFFSTRQHFTSKQMQNTGVRSGQTIPTISSLFCESHRSLLTYEILYTSLSTPSYRALECIFLPLVMQRYVGLS